MSNITRHLLVSVWRSHGSVRERWVIWLLLGLAVLTPLVVWALVPGPQAGRAALAVVAVVWSILLAVAWSFLCFEALRQNLPVLARTVPGQVAALRRALMTLAMPLAGLAALWSAAWSGSETPGVLLASAVCGLLALLLRWPAAVVAGLLGLCLLPLWALGQVAMQAGLRMVEPWLRPSVWLDGVAVLGLWVALHAVILSGGPRHAQAQLRLRGLMHIQPGPGSCRDGVLAVLGGRLGSWLGARRLARPETPGLARYALGLGPGGQAWPAVVQASALGGVGLALMGAGVIWPDNTLAMTLRSGFLIGAVGNTAMTAALQWQQLLLNTRREQALMRLLPGTPQGAALSRWLVALLARRYLLCIAVNTGVLMLLGGLFQMPPGAGWVPGAVACVGVLSAGGLALLWRDWSLASAARSRRVSEMALLYLLGLGGATVWTVLLRWPWWGLALGALLALPVLLAWRWRRVVMFPQPFPAARTAG